MGRCPSSWEEILTVPDSSIPAPTTEEPFTLTITFALTLPSTLPSARRRGPPSRFSPQAQPQPLAFTFPITLALALTVAPPTTPVQCPPAIILTQSKSKP